MRSLLLVSLVAAAAAAPVPQVGVFPNAADIGAPPLQGRASYDAATRQYTVTGTGADIWGKADQFHYVWREMTGNFAVTATAAFMTEGNPHRKASIMLRKTADADSPFLHFAVHGDGLASLQFRTAKADDTNTLDFPIDDGPGRYTLKLVREGSNVNVFIARDGGELRELGQTFSSLGSPVLVGLAVASHSTEARNTVVFSNVSVDQPLPAPPAAR